MSNGIYQASRFTISQKYYEETRTSFKIRGTLLDKNKNSIKLRIGEGKVMEAELRKPIEAKIGETVIIDKKQILQSKLSDVIEELTKGMEKVEKDKEIVEILKKMDIPVHEDSKAAVTSLKDHGVKISKGVIEGFMASKNQLEHIIEGLDYKTAVKLMENNIDMEKESLQKVTDMMQKVKDEKEGFSFLKFFTKKKEMSQEEAEKVAKKLYGNKMGKDITDAIKALHKAGLDTTRKNINRIHTFFNKIDDLQQIKDETIIEAVKNKIDTTVDYLYKLKNAVTKGAVSGDAKITSAVASIYEGSSYQPSKISEGDLKLMEEDIKGLLEASNIKATDEVVNLSKEFIKTGVELTKDNIERLQAIKEAIGELKDTLDYEKTANLMRSGIEVEKEDIVELMKKAKEVSSLDTTDTETIDKGKAIVEDLENLEKLDDKKLLELIKQGRDINLKTLLQIADTKRLLKDSLSIDKLEANPQTVMDKSIRLAKVLNELKDLKLDTIGFQINNQLPMTIRALATSHRFIKTKDEIQGLEEQRDSIQNKETIGKLEQEARELTEKLEQELPQKGEASIKTSKVMGDKAIDVIKDFIKQNAQKLGIVGEEKDLEAATALVKNNIPVNKANIMQLYEINSHIDNIKNNLSTNRVKEAIEEKVDIENLELEKLAEKVMKPQQETIKSNNQMTLGFKRLEFLQSIKNIEANTIAYQIKNQLPMTLEALGLSQQLLEEEATNKASLQNNIPLNKAELQKLYQLERAIEKITAGLTTETLSKIVDKGKSLEKLSLQEIVDLMEDKKEEQVRGEITSEKIKNLMESMEQVSHQQKDSILSVLLKNAMPVTLKEVQGLSFFLSNQQQIGSQVKDILKTIDKHPRKEIQEIASNIKEQLQVLSKDLKQGKLESTRPYEALAKALQELESKAGLLEEGMRNSIKNSGEKLLDSLETQIHLNKEDTVLQLPIMMGDEFKNLQIYVMKDKKGSRKIDPRDMSILLNFDTNNMGNVNVYVGVNYKKVVMKMGLNRHEDRTLMESYTKKMETMLEEMGYELKDFSFRVEEDQHILSLTDEIEELQGKTKNMLDVKV
ncbi:MAG: hypothetical protein JJT76_11415 [Clostridiaceae bacterium]|nr:hypothetical protein [Clostridiaceae bacterium]